MKAEINSLQCPACSHEFDANEILTQQVVDQVEETFKEKEQALRASMAEQKSVFEEKLKQVELLESQREEIMDQRIREKNERVKQKLELKLKSEA